MLRNCLRHVHAAGGPGLTRDSPPGCEGGCCCANEFTEREARKDLERLRQSGPPDTTRWLIDELSAGGVEGWTVLDVGAGVGAVHLALLESGASAAVDVDASSAYVAAARDEAARRGVSDRVRHEVGDFTVVAPDVEAADVVVLDRVVCCYGDMASLVSLSAARARRRYGLVYPKDAAWIRFGFGITNAISRIFRSRTRIYAHRTADVDGLIRAAGLAPKTRRTNVFWQIVVYERPTA